MTVLIHSTIAIVFSLACLLLLIRSDAKRHRKDNHLMLINSRMRLIIGLSASLPLLVLFAIGSYTALLVWMGAVSVAGWLLAMIPSHTI